MIVRDRDTLHDCDTWAGYDSLPSCDTLPAGYDSLHASYDILYVCDTSHDCDTFL